MSGFVWQYPAALVALSGVLLPLIIHLLDRGSRRQLDFAPLYLLEELPRASLRRLRLRERLLWLLRTLLIVLAAALLAAPALRPERVPANAWLLVQSGLGESAGKSVERLAEKWQIEPEAIETRWLAPGFARLADRPEPPEQHNPWGLLLAADMQLSATARLAVLAHPLATELGPVRPRLSRPVEWLAARAERPSPGIAEDGIGLRVYVGATDGRGELVPLLHAVVTAWRRALNIGVSVVADPAAADWILFAGDGELAGEVEAAVRGGALAITDSPGSAGAYGEEPVRRRLGAGLWLHEPHEWSPEMRELSLGLWSELSGARLEPLPVGVAVNPNQARPGSGADLRVSPPRSLGGLFGALLLWLLAAERWLSSRVSPGRES